MSDDISCITSAPAAVDDVLVRLAAAAGSAGYDALVALSPENVAYCSGVVVPSQSLMRWRHAATLVGADGTQAMLCVDMEESTVRAARPDIELRVWQEFAGNAMAVLADLLSDMHLASGRVGLELSYLSVRDFAELKRLLPDSAFGPADDIFTRCRRLKTDAEVERIARLSRIADGAIGAACANVRAADTELDLAAEMTRVVYEGGAQQFKLMIVATGERSQLPNAGPTSRRLVPGDVCRLEIFAVADGYHAGVCRTAVVGEPSADAMRIYRNLADARTVVLDALRPGVAAAEVYRRFRECFDVLGLAPISFVGHGIGLDLHEPPYLGDFDPSELEAGVTLGIEPLVYRTPYGFGMQIKDMVTVGHTAARLLSDVTATEQLLKIEA